MAELEPYEVYAVRYAHHASATRAQNFLGGDPHDGPMPLDYFVWAVKGNGRTFIIDTGFDETISARRDREFLRSPGEGLKMIDIDPDTVEDVIITHMHYDHCGNYDLFPRARYHLQDIEMAYCTGRCMCHDGLRLPFEEEDVVAVVVMEVGQRSLQTMCRQRRLCMAGCHRRRGVAHLLAVGRSACPKPGLMSMMEVTHTHAHKCCLGRALGSTIIMALAEAVEAAAEYANGTGGSVADIRVALAAVEAALRGDE
mgnify:CR=1 FL=1